MAADHRERSGATGASISLVARKSCKQKIFLLLTAAISAKDLLVSRRFDPDHTDRAILRLIQRDAALSLADIAKEVGLTPTPCWKRIRKMEQEGVITGRVVLLDPEKVGLGVSVFVAIETGDHSAPWIESFATTVAKMPEIVECWRLGGDVDYLLRVVVPDMQAFDTFYRRLTAQVPALRKVTSRFAMERVKSTTALPI
ncbi:Lrp/AsnC family transcriptional regulator [Roseomonas terrae]|uniref:Lrp/AsnC family transcriptional regulator n=1 Tax=Neoroseomonas terrae TaxID=424799 RepID=A0ABS5EJU1_9PROT|nr:Lrp/AsnC family transcriptional regulator [Neoroseomonas terrae]